MNSYSEAFITLRVIPSSTEYIESKEGSASEGIKRPPIKAAYIKAEKIKRAINADGLQCDIVGVEIR